jgi:hypothetical protein
MKFAWLGCLLWGSLLIAGNPQSDMNVNTRYTVESVEFSGGGEARISSGLRREIARLAGEKLNPANLDELARRIRKELHVRSVSHHLLRGDNPEHVKVVFEIKGRPRSYEVSVPKFLYHATQGWSAAVEGTAEIARQRFSAGLVSDGDDMLERYAGITGRYENLHLGTDRVRLGFLAESYHEQWNRATRLALAPDAGDAGLTSAVYRERQNFEPTVTVTLAGPLTLTVGAGFARLEPDLPAASTESSNALITTLRYHRRVEDSAAGQQELDAGYTLRAATKVLGSDFVYSRHHLSVRYAWTAGRHTVLDEATAGWIVGRAPLFERFVLGTSSTLRGWNKFDLDPLGGDRVAHNTIEYRYRFVEAFYDTGAVWNSGQGAVLRHAVGVGLRRGSFSLAIAFPVRENRVEPVLMLGMNY